MQQVEKDKDRDRKEMDYSRAHLYRMYYEVQAVFAQGGSSWKKFNNWFQTPLYEAQNADGSWPVTGVAGPEGCGGGLASADMDIYRTAVNTLMLEVYYRYLPVIDI
jgi:hypothetical protein